MRGRIGFREPLIPTGLYLFEIVSSEPWESEKGQACIKALLRPADYAHEYRSIPVYLVIGDGHGTRFTERFLCAVGLADYKLTNATRDALVGRRLYGEVRHETYRGSVRPKVVNYAPVVGEEQS